jgi:flagellar hook protein FlgE
MMRSMFSAISGLKNHQTFMDVVANNIANVNTTGFKQSRVTFQDILSQTVRGASGPQAGRGGVNGEQIGLGVVLGGIDTIQTQGTLQSTGKLTDMAIQGDGYFELSDGKQNFFTRDGSFDLAIGDNTLVNPSNGLKVMGWQADPVTGVVDSTRPATSIQIPIGAGMTGKASSTLGVTGNLDSRAPVATVPPTPPPAVSATVYDSLGNAVPATLTAVMGAQTATGTTWTITATTEAVAAVAAVPAIPYSAGPPVVQAVPAVNAVAAVPATTTPFTVVFNTAGKFVSSTPAPSTITIPSLNPGAAALSVDVDFSAMTQLAGESNLITDTDGASAGSLTTFSVGQNGDITGVYSNGFKQALGQIALASFSNPSGLMKAGGNLLQASANSGNPNVGIPGANGRGQIATGFLEGSNVDLAQQFTNMIMAERGFQANSKVITTSDEILQDLVNLKR